MAPRNTFGLVAHQAERGRYAEEKDRPRSRMPDKEATARNLFLRSGNARRVLFLVDRLELENQAWKSFTAVLSADYQAVY